MGNERASVQTQAERKRILLAFTGQAGWLAAVLLVNVAKSSRQPFQLPNRAKTSEQSKAGRMDSKRSLDVLPLGLIELDATGTVLYYKPEQKEDLNATPPLKIVGRNFFTEIAPVAHASEFQELIRSFARSPAPATSFNFTFLSGHMTLPVRVLLARIHENSGLERTESLFVHIRAGQHQIAA
jgi:photoactive yellow protein